MSNTLSHSLISDIKKLGDKYLIDKIILFGSRARGDNKSNSDVDLAIFTLPGFAHKGFLTSDIDELNTLLKIDIVFINKDTDIKLLKNIEKEGVLLYERLSN
ncbi:nucleotidyltransferase domain-containing protein [Tissierella sp. Yu-01]|jgi:predicted nucleotidyltransferase|uniref:nucleotidyltransferase domain-containing protein n=1 Tax=Tissierella sp. Yu-01 TaxID=3035694 RepID=UPI00240E4C03|nr:nucleotidyltransferase domain-containing protein [Tissierella sp. Yu-01]WFA08546.1 nucleotidyltransferase domain-containing protein [Tissierella sp. Yu-01]